jgi:competence protein ComEA
MKTGWGIALGVLCGLLAAAILLVVSTGPRGEPVQLSPPPTLPPLVVHVTGAVAQTGVYPLPPDSRIEDALEAAGGPLPGADLDSLNLAAFLEDGERLWVPYRAQASPSPQNNLQIQDQSSTISQDSPDPAGLIDINTASAALLETLPGIGPVMAERILAYRQEHGPFGRIEDIENVPGIGPMTFEKLKPLISVGLQP